ncbi:MAG: efflux RND transporter permease subunit [Planctomycetes bacterium]|nr:efflux RND transporter permease subunit [Planctomycetota bacterium]
MIARFINACLDMKLLVLLATAGAVVFGFKALLDNPKDAIPDISVNQVIVSAEWMGRSPQDVENQVTYPLAAAMQALPRVEDVRSMSGFGMSRVYVIFEDGVDIYWARSRVLERMAVAAASLPEGVVPTLGPDATALGQVFMYTLDGPYDLAALRSIQDYTVRYALQQVDGVAEVASIGGFVREYQVEIDPERLRAHDIMLDDVVRTLQASNLDVGAKAIEAGGSEFLVRGVGFLKRLDDIELLVVKNQGHVPVRVGDIARVQVGPEFRRGALADGANERVGGIVTIRFGANPLDAIHRVKAEIARISDTLPAGVSVNPFYDRTDLIHETLDTLKDTLIEEIIVTALVILIFLLHLRSGLIVASTFPLAMLLGFIGMQAFGVSSNIMSLGGIAIAIGDIADMSIIMVETIYVGLLADAGKSPRMKVVKAAAGEVGGAIVTSVATTVISFVPIFFLTGQSYKLFAPMAWTKTLTLTASLFLAICLSPVLCYLFLGGGRRNGQLPPRQRRFGVALKWVAALGIAALLAWITLRSRAYVEAWLGLNATFVAIPVFILAALAVLRLWHEPLTPIESNPVARGLVGAYRPMLRYFLAHKNVLRIASFGILLLGAMAALGAGVVLWPIKQGIAALGGDADRVRPIAALQEHYPGFGQEFMPPLDEGSVLFMPSLLSQASLSETLRVMEWQTEQILTVPEVEHAIGKLGRAETALDPAPVGMIETVVLLKPRDQWRKGMDRHKLVAELRRVTNLKGVAPSWLQPIQTRVVMLSSGIRSRIGLEILGDDANSLAELALALEPLVKDVPGAADVVAMRTGGKPYVQFEIKRDRLSHYGLTVMMVQQAIEVAIGGTRLTTTVEGRERYPVRIRYERDLRDKLEDLERILVATPGGAQIPIADVADIEYVVGPSEIRGANGKVASYVTFNTVEIDETTLIGRVAERLKRAIDGGEIHWPRGYTYNWVGQYQELQRTNAQLAFIIPLVLLIILLVIYQHFRKWSWTLIVFTGLPLNLAGAALMIRYWPFIQSLFTGQPQGPPIYVTVAVIVGFMVLAGVVLNDGVVLGTYVDQLAAEKPPRAVTEVRDLVVEAGSRRIRPAFMTTLTSIIGVMPILWATGRGSDVMQPMALPIFGGMLVDVISLFMVPVMMSWWMERRLRREMKRAASMATGAP